tara:strand:+ start:282 stop:521 length:240 start_codon:yes stop_codon:yes gene_type:complete
MKLCRYVKQVITYHLRDANISSVRVKEHSKISCEYWKKIIKKIQTRKKKNQKIITHLSHTFFFRRENNCTSRSSSMERV